MSAWYFYSFGRCKRCLWPHHGRVDVPERPARSFLWWRRPARPARSYVFCCNCDLRTDVAVWEGSR